MTQSLKTIDRKQLQYSLDMRNDEAKQTELKHLRHLKKLEEISKGSTMPKIKQHANSCRNLTESMHKYREISKSFKEKEFNLKRHHDDLKMLQSIGEIQRSRQKLFTSSEKQRKQFLCRQENMARAIQHLRDKQLDEENMKLAKRIFRHEQDNSYKRKMGKDIHEYVKLKNHMKKIKELSHHKTHNKPPKQGERDSRMIEELIDQNSNVSSRFAGSEKVRKTRAKFYTEADEVDEACRIQGIQQRMESSMKTEDLIKLLNDRTTKQQKGESAKSLPKISATLSTAINNAEEASENPQQSKVKQRNLEQNQKQRTTPVSNSKIADKNTLSDSGLRRILISMSGNVESAAISEVKRQQNV